MLQEGRDDLPSLLFALLSCIQAGIISLNAEGFGPAHRCLRCRFCGGRVFLVACQLEEAAV